MLTASCQFLPSFTPPACLPACLPACVTSSCSWSCSSLLLFFTVFCRTFFMSSLLRVFPLLLASIVQHVGLCGVKGYASQPGGRSLLLAPSCVGIVIIIFITIIIIIIIIVVTAVCQLNERDEKQTNISCCCKHNINVNTWWRHQFSVKV